MKWWAKVTVPFTCRSHDSVSSNENPAKLMIMGNEDRSPYTSACQAKLLGLRVGLYLSHEGLLTPSLVGGPVLYLEVFKNHLFLMPDSTWNTWKIWDREEQGKDNLKIAWLTMLDFSAGIMLHG